jgi:hypothetical protein
VSDVLFELNRQATEREKDLISEVIKLANRCGDIDNCLHQLCELQQLPVLGLVTILKCNEKFSDCK